MTGGGSKYPVDLERPSHIASCTVICPPSMQSVRYASCFRNICFLDGRVRVFFLLLCGSLYCDGLTRAMFLLIMIWMRKHEHQISPWWLVCSCSMLFEQWLDLSSRFESIRVRWRDCAPQSCEEQANHRYCPFLTTTMRHSSIRSKNRSRKCSTFVRRSMLLRIHLLAITAICAIVQTAVHVVVHVAAKTLEPVTVSGQPKH